MSFPGRRRGYLGSKRCALACLVKGGGGATALEAGKMCLGNSGASLHVFTGAGMRLGLVGGLRTWLPCPRLGRSSLLLLLPPPLLPPPPVPAGPILPASAGWRRRQCRRSSIGCRQAPSCPRPRASCTCCRTRRRGEAAPAARPRRARGAPGLRRCSPKGGRGEPGHHVRPLLAARPPMRRRRFFASTAPAGPWPLPFRSFSFCGAHSSARRAHGRLPGRAAAAGLAAVEAAA